MKPITWSAASWRSTEVDHIATIPGMSRDMAIAVVEDIHDGILYLPYSHRGAARRQQSREADLRVWIGELVETLDAHHLVRALRAWACSNPGDIRRQWESLPDPIRFVLADVCAVLDSRGGSSSYGPTSSALVGILAGQCDDEHSLDRAVADDDWQCVAMILRGRNLSEWRYSSGAPLPERLGATI